MNKRIVCYAKSAYILDSVTLPNTTQCHRMNMCCTCGMRIVLVIPLQEVPPLSPIVTSTQVSEASL